MFGFFNSRSSLAETGLMKGFQDNHSHILFGVDDGVGTLEESLKILSFLETKGVSVVWCTPHIMEDVPNTTDSLKRRFGELQKAWCGSIELRLASENMMDNLFEKRLAARDLLLHGDNELLVETSTWAPPMRLWEIIADILDYGYVPIVAHPERYRYMKDEDYARLQDMGAKFQLNLPSILGVYGEEEARKAESMLEKGWYSMVGSDCHRFRAIEGQMSCKILSKKTVALLKTIM